MNQIFLATLFLLLFPPSLRAQQSVPGLQGLGDARTLTDDFPGAIGRQNNPDTGPILELPDVPFIDLNIRQPQDNQEVALSLQLLLLLTIIALTPTLLLLLTCFLRISIVLDFIRRALTLQQSPPNNIILGISLFVTLFVMWPIFSNIYTNAFRPFTEGEISLQELYIRSRSPIKRFMFQQMANNTSTLELFISTSGADRPETLEDIPMQVLIPAYILNELTVAFRLGILIYIPFVVLDMVVASILMSMGMIMLPPVMISMPFKLILFVSIDGWGLIVRQLIETVRQNMEGF